jgi:hypothetical protein
MLPMSGHIQAPQQHVEQPPQMPLPLTDLLTTALTVRFLGHPPGNEVGTQECHYLALHQDHPLHPQDPIALVVSGVIPSHNALGKAAVLLIVFP